MRTRYAVLGGLLLALFLMPVAALAGAKEKNAILISWDGVQREHMKEQLSRGELPNLAALIKEGTMVDVDVTHQTDTKPGHAQMLSGYDPETTGVHSNQNFRPIPEGLTIFERLRAALGKTNIKTVMLTGKKTHIGSAPPNAEVKANELDPGDTVGTGNKRLTAKERKAARVRALNKYGEPWYLAKSHMDVWDGDVARDATIVGPKAMGYLDKYGNQRFFMFFHFSDPDHMGHAHGENSREENGAYITCDKWLGEIVTKLKSLGVYQDTLVFVNSDHGFDEGLQTHHDAPRVFLATNDKNVAHGGNQRDMTPTILAEMGVDVSTFTPPYPGKSLTAR